MKLKTFQVTAGTKHRSKVTGHDKMVTVLGIYKQARQCHLALNTCLEVLLD